MLLREPLERVPKKKWVTQRRKMAETVSEITIDWKDENGQQLVRQLKKEVLTSGAWSTIMFMYQDFDKKAGDWGPKKVRVVRYQKRGGKFIPQSKFNISSAKQARQIIENLQNWLPEMDDKGNSEDLDGSPIVNP
jgi:translation initiation factor 1 (eIF-1/SUI1)